MEKGKEKEKVERERYKRAKKEHKEFCKRRRGNETRNG